MSGSCWCEHRRQRCSSSAVTMSHPCCVCREQSLYLKSAPGACIQVRQRCDYCLTDHIGRAPMTTIDTSLIELIEELPSEARNEVRDFVEFLIAKQRRELARQAEANGWPPGAFENTAGSI